MLQILDPLLHHLLRNTLKINQPTSRCTGHQVCKIFCRFLYTKIYGRLRERYKEKAEERW